jgi:hypothetical protein
MLRFRLSPTDWERVTELAAKARVGVLRIEERTELDEDERIPALLELLQSKARLSMMRITLLSFPLQVSALG